MIERVTIRLPQDLLRRAKRRASAEGRTVTALIEEGLHRVLSDVAPDTKARHILPPVSSMTGGLKPGIDLSDAVALQEMENLDRAKQFR